MTSVFDHPWLGGLFDDEQALLIWSPHNQITHILAFEAAFTRALGVVGKIPSIASEAIAKRIETFEPDMAALRAGTAKDGVVVPELVRQLRTRIVSDTNTIHHGATSQDAIDTALALTLKDFNGLLATRLTALLQAINSVEIRFGGNPLMGCTRMQAAMHITVSDRLRTWSSPVEGHLARLERLRPSVERLQLGGAAGDRSALEPHGETISKDMAKRLGLAHTANAWHATREGLADYSNLLSLITGTLGKMGQDICLMAQQGIDEITMQAGGGSSAMPHKQNPVLAELLVTLARFNATQLSGMHHALVHEQERSGAAWALEWMILPQMAQASARSLFAATEVVNNITRIGTKAST
jgi:3-carboxy-cis,cis-muconate cycloisomerase